MKGHCTVLAGGTGAAKFLRGLTRVLPAERVHIVANVGDDDEFWGLHVSPDLDTILYALSGELDNERGWGRRDETFHCLEAIARYDMPTWFRLGDRDLSTHLARTDMLRRGASLEQVTEALSRRLGVRSEIFPATNDRLRTKIETPLGILRFQEFFVRDRWTAHVRNVFYEGVDQARAPARVLESILRAAIIIVAPSNPITSIGPILAVGGIRDALRRTPARVVAISPIIGSEAVSGPAGKLMKACGYEDVSPKAVARCYHDFLDAIVVHTSDKLLAPAIRKETTIEVQVTNILMPDLEQATGLARFVTSENYSSAGQEI